MIRSTGFFAYSPLINGKFQIRLLSTPIASFKIQEEHVGRSIRDTDEWKNALPFENLPGPTKFKFILSLMPGGKYYKMPLNKLMESTYKEYGVILKMPAFAGNPDFIVSHDPDVFQQVFRNEGPWPYRRGFKIVDYYRTKYRPEMYAKAAGLTNSQGKEWGDFRSIVNPVMMQPKTVKLYIPTIDNVTTDLINRIREIRNTKTSELPENFEDELNRWALESIGAIALDTRLGLIGEKSTNSKSKLLIASVKEFFQLLFEFEFQPSVWTIIATPKFRRFMKVLDTITDISNEYIQEAKQRIESRTTGGKLDHEQGVLEKLLKIDPNIALVMALDMIMAGVDTTTSTLVSLLYNLAKNPEKQKILHKELLSILPTKDTPLTPENMNEMPYLRACFKESQRILPLIDSNLRATSKDMILSGYRIPKGTDIIMLYSGLQMQDNIYPDAMKFLPERWLKGEQANGCPSAKTAHPFIFLPFGFGPRMCIGKRFAQMEIECLTARIIRNFFVEWNHPDLEYRSTGINVPISKLMFKLTDIDQKH